MILPSLLLTLLSQPTAALHQCCLGAQDHESASPDGRFTVKANSLDGTGIDHHGPYRYRFTGNLRNPELLSFGMQFERSWDTRAHFAMRTLVSPTGNGFVLDSSLEEALVCYGSRGEELWRLEVPEEDQWLRIR